MTRSEQYHVLDSKSGMGRAELPVVLATAGYDHTIRLWDVVKGTCVSTIQHTESQVNCLAVTPDKRQLAAAGNPSIKIFDPLSSNGVFMSLDGHLGNVTHIGYLDGSSVLYSSSEDGTIKLWDLRAGKHQKEFNNRTAVNSCVSNTRGTEIITADQTGRLRVWDIASSACLCEAIPEDHVPINTVAISSDGNLLAIANYLGRVYLWRQDSSEKCTFSFVQSVPGIKFKAHDTYITHCAFSPDLKSFATGSADNNINLWNIKYEKEEIVQFDKRLEGHSKWVWDFSYSADSAYIVSASSDDTARLWDVDSGETICIYSGHNKGITSVALNDLAQ